MGSEDDEEFPVCLWKVDLEWNMVSCNNFTAQTFGANWPLNDTLLHNDDLFLVKESIHNAMTSGSDLVVRHRSLVKGRYIWFLSRAKRDKFGFWKGSSTDVHDLQSSREELKKVIDTIALMVWKCDKNGKFVYGNNKWKDYIGDSVTSAVEDPRIVHPLDFERVTEAWFEARRKGEPFEVERRLKSKEGVYTWFLTRAVPVRLDSHIIAWYGTCTNIQQQKELSERLQDNEMWWKDLANSMPSMVWTSNAEGVVNFYNDKWYEFTQQPRGLEGDESWYYLHHPQYVDTIHTNWYHSVKTKEPYDATFMLLDKTSNTYKWFRGRADFVPKYNRWVGTITDIDDLQRALAEARSAEYKFTMITETLPIIIFATDKSGKVLFNVGRGKDLIPEKERVKEGDNIFTVGDPSRRYLFERLITTGEPLSIRANYGTRVFQNTLHPTRDKDNSITGIMVISYDITDEVQAVEERNKYMVAEKVAVESNKVKTQFLANMSHELRTPLTGILGFSEFLMDTPLNSEQQGYVEVIRKNVDYLTVLVNDILDITRMEYGKLDIRDVNFNPRDVVNDVMAVFKMEADDKGLYLKSNVSDDVPLWLRGDPYRLRQVITNLVSNAVKFTLYGGVCLTITCTYQDDGNVHIVISVKDTGIGMSEEMVSRLFKPFQQGDVSNTRRFGGTGLGLYITKLILTALKGDITVNSELNVGTTMIVTIPYSTDVHLDETTKVIQHIMSVEDLRNRTVLIAEDNSINRVIARRALEKFGVHVVTAENGLKAVEIFEKDHAKIDLVLLDIQMPVMDGFTALRKMQEIDKNLVAIAMTASAMKEDVERSFSAGMADHVSKPFRADDLVQTVLRNIRLKKTEDV